MFDSIRKRTTQDGMVGRRCRDVAGIQRYILMVRVLNGRGQGVRDLSRRRNDRRSFRRISAMSRDTCLQLKLSILRSTYMSWNHKTDSLRSKIWAVRLSPAPKSRYPGASEPQFYFTPPNGNGKVVATAWPKPSSSRVILPFTLVSSRLRWN